MEQVVGEPEQPAVALADEGVRLSAGIAQTAERQIGDVIGQMLPVEAQVALPQGIPLQAVAGPQGSDFDIGHVRRSASRWATMLARLAPGLQRRGARQARMTVIAWPR